MTSLIFPDVNAALALITEDHLHHQPVLQWYQRQQNVVLIFYRLTQLGLLRLLTTAAVMGTTSVRSNAEAWVLFDSLFVEGAAEYWEEPYGMDAELRSRSAVIQSSPKLWSDAYIQAFAHAHRLSY